MEITLLKQILSCRTAPFREMYVDRLVCELFDQGRVPYCHDDIGNIIVGADSVKNYRNILSKRADEPLRVFIAHMDHPGFHGTKWLDQRRLQVRWLGGAPIKYVNGTKVWLDDGDGGHWSGTLTQVEHNKNRTTLAKAVVRVNVLFDKKPPASRLFGGFDFRAPVWRRGKRLYARVIDDLVGVYAVVKTALELYKKRQGDIPFLALLTRGEEVGFVGAVGHFQSGLLQAARRPVLCVSLEASRTLPGADFGKGPVLRQGDRRTIFHAGGMKMLEDIAQTVIPGRFQKRVMDGGACEATAATVFGLPTIGITLPLGNYHNQGFEGGDDCKRISGPAPEFVHLDDVAGYVTLCQALVHEKLPWSDPWSKTRSQLGKNFTKYQRYL